MRLLLLAGVLAACTEAAPPATLILHNGRVHSFAWDDPGPDGTPAANAPFTPSEGWRPGASAIALRGDSILFIGDDSAALAFRGAETRVIDLAGEVVIPGLVDAHVHVAELGQSLERVNLTDVPDESTAVARIVDRATEVPPGEWIIGYGWDEGAWANRYPDRRLLSARVPDHPVVLRGLHGFATWANDRALAALGITAATTAPTGGEIRRDASGAPTGLFLNRAVQMVDDALPPPLPPQRDSQVVRALRVLAAGGYTAVHEAGTPREVVESLRRLDVADRLPIRVYAMLNGRDTTLLREWAARGPLMSSTSGTLVVRAVKAYYDGALGSRGAQLLEDYSDRAGHRGVSGGTYGFDRAAVATAMAAGFQVAIHAIGDAGNRATLDFIDSVAQALPATRALRHRVEHAQVVHPEDLGRFAASGIIASMQPPHAVEDMPWAQERLGPRRVEGAYAWRAIRQGGGRLVFSSDLPGSDWNIFYGLHAAITRQDKDGNPDGGWFPAQRMTPEEAIRGYTSWAAYAAFDEARGGMLAPGRRADLSVLSVDPLSVASTQDLLSGKVRLTVSRGRIVFSALPTP
jgi:predicted amidohydrolase YtcJ